jgi:hypothetical protein
MHGEEVCVLAVFRCVMCSCCGGCLDAKLVGSGVNC